MICDSLLSVSDVAELTRLSPATLRKLETNGGMPQRVQLAGSRVVRYSAEAIRDWIDSGCKPVAPVTKEAGNAVQS